jgi:hypothetical protein
VESAALDRYICQRNVCVSCKTHLLCLGRQSLAARPDKHDWHSHQTPVVVSHTDARAHLDLCTMCLNVYVSQKRYLDLRNWGKGRPEMKQGRKTETCCPEVDNQQKQAVRQWSAGVCVGCLVWVQKEWAVRAMAGAQQTGREDVGKEGRRSHVAGVSLHVLVSRCILRTCGALTVPCFANSTGWGYADGVGNAGHGQMVSATATSTPIEACCSDAPDAPTSSPGTYVSGNALHLSRGRVCTSSFNCWFLAVRDSTTRAVCM